MIRQGELVGRQLMAYETTEEVGTVEHLLVDMKLAQVVGLVYKTAAKTAGLIARRQTLSWSQLVKIGRDRILIHHPAELTEHAEAAAQLAAAQDVVGLEVWTDGGDRIGQIVDLCLDVATGKVQQYLFTLNYSGEPSEVDLADELDHSEDDFERSEAAAKTVSAYIIAPQTIISAGRKRMMIAEEDAYRAKLYDQPLSTLLSVKPSARLDWRSEQLPEMPTDFGELLQRGQSLAGRVGERVKQQAKRFTDERLAHQDLVDADSLPEIADQLQAKTDQLKQQMQQRFHQAKDQLDHQLEDRLGHTSLGRSLGRSLDQTLGRFKRSPAPKPPEDPIDIEAFEVWEDD
jgi:uncharacterized protein YrrD